MRLYVCVMVERGRERQTQAVEAAKTKYDTGWLIHNRHLFLTVLEAGSVIAVAAWPGSGEALCQVAG